MKTRILASLLALFVSARAPAGAESAWERRIPWRAAGLSERQAAAHMLDRFAYGPRPGEVETVVELGLGNWVEEQLAGDLPGAVLAGKLSRLPATALTNREIVQRFSYHRGWIANEAIAAGVISRRDYSGQAGERNLQKAVAALDRFIEKKGYRPAAELLGELRAQKVYRAVYSQSQVVEVLTDFWFNHFNVSITDGRCQPHVLSYERDAIRPHVLGTFRELLGAVARHPAMLLYLNNALSAAPPRVTTVFDLEMRELDRLSPADNPTLRVELAKALGWRDPRLPLPRGMVHRGLNENYARELLELHTLGVEGGYGQRDVIEVARAFTGWTVFPPGDARGRLEEVLAGSRTAADMGFVVDGEFLFRPDYHDSEAKTVLGVALAAGRGIEDGEEVLDLVARHPATRRHLARKLAVRFVSENPPAALVERLVETWELTGGDLREVVRALLGSPELWSEPARRSKVKSPFELAISALRALDAEVEDPTHLIAWIDRMGQSLYGYSAPTGYPDRSSAWTHVGPLLARLNFAQALSHGGVSGVEIDLLGFPGVLPLESVEDAAETYFHRLMPAREAAVTLELVGDAVGEPGGNGRARAAADPRVAARLAADAVGILLGSPEFQVR